MKSKYVIPVLIAAAVAVLWYVLSGNTQAATVNVPNTQGSGVNPTTTGGYPGVAPYLAAIPASGGDPQLTSLPGPSIVGPTYLSYNFPQGDNYTQASSQAPDTGCGCNDSCQTCNTNIRFPDGKGTGLAYNGQTLLANTNPSVWDSLLQKLASTGEVNPMLAAQYYSYAGQLADGGTPAGSVRPN